MNANAGIAIQKQTLGARHEMTATEQMVMESVRSWIPALCLCNWVLPPPTPQRQPRRRPIASKVLRMG